MLKLRHISCAVLLIIVSIPTTQPVMAEQWTTAHLQEVIQKANDGDMRAQVDLASRFHVGDGIDKDLVQAAYWYRKLADNGVAEAQLTLGLMYIKGEGLQRDDQQALHWLTLAAEQRLSSAQYLLGVAYDEGHGVKQDNIKAYMWYEISAAMDYENAVAARQALSSKMTKEEIVKAEQMATEWWMKFHH
jgi:TPR repeat protein